MAEDHKERVNRELREFLEELRVTLPGVEIIFAFLLTIPFTERFHDLDHSLHNVYLLAVSCMALASVLLIAPAVHHRTRFRTADKEQMLKTGTVAAIAAAGFLTVGFPAALYVVTHVVFGGTTAAIAATTFGVVTAVLWYVVPLFYRRPR